MMVQQVIFGPKSELPELPIDAFGYSTDTKEFFIGTSSGNVLMVKANDRIAKNSVGGSYLMELERWGIDPTGGNPTSTTQGINAAIAWAQVAGYSHIYLPGGIYTVRIDPRTFTAIEMRSGIHLELAHDCEIRLEANSSPEYRIFEIKALEQVKISGGTIVGDKEDHIYELQVRFERGGVNADGSLNDDPGWIRSEVLDRYKHPGLFANFRLWNLPGVNTSTYSFFQYKDVVSKETLVGNRTNGGFAPSSPTGRGWFLNDQGGIAENNKMILSVKLSSPMTDEQIGELRGKLDNSKYTHEFGYGIGIFGSQRIEIFDVEISNCTGDGMITGWEQYHTDPTQYTQEQMGQYISIHHCHIHHCRRQGISLCAANDVYVGHNHIHHIGYADDGVTTNSRHGTPPMFGIDIESMVGETNIPYKSETRPDGYELNYRITIEHNYIHHNVRGHFVNSDGTFISLSENIFEGGNVGGISSNPKYSPVQFVNNTFTGCSLIVQGDNIVNGATFKNGNLRFLDVRGATVQNCRIIDGKLNGSSVYGYFGTPIVDIGTSTFTLSKAHGMGNGAKLSFEQWTGKLPTGLSVDTMYYTVNVTPASFQVAESLGGAPVKVSDAGEPGFNVSRYDYGRCYISNITIERDWRDSTALDQGLNLLITGAVLRDITVKNYDISILVPEDYAGRPNIVEGLTLIEGSARIEATHVRGAQFMRAKSRLMGSTDIQFGSNNLRYARRLTASACLFQELGAVLAGNVTLHDCTFINSAIGKPDNMNKAVITSSYLEDTNVYFHWLRQEKAVVLANNVFNGVTIAGSEPYIILKNNTEIN